MPFWVRLVPFVALCASLVGCGRLGYDSHLPAADGGPIDARDAATPSPCERLPPGALDPSFGESGISRLVSLPGLSSVGQQVLEDAEGRLLVTAHTNLESNAFAGTRLGLDGEVDRTYGEAGHWVVDVGPGNDKCRAAALDGDGRLLVGGTSAQGGDRATALVRVDGDGATDTTFGDRGIVVDQHYVGGEEENLSDIVMDPEGRIVGAGYIEDGDADQGYVVRYLADGSLDASFGTGGLVLLEPLGDSLGEVVTLVEGGIVVGGQVRPAASWRFAAWRFAQDGSLDPSYGNNGTVVMEAARAQVAGHGAADSDGGLVLGGWCYTGVHNAPCIGRFTRDGRVDVDFADGGFSIIHLPGGSGQIFGLVIDAEGRIVVGGDRLTGDISDLFVLRLDSTGDLDRSFGAEGMVFFSQERSPGLFASSSESIKGLLIDRESRILFAGFSQGEEGPHDLVVGRLCP